MVLAHDRRQVPLELAEQVAEPAVAVAIGLALAVFLPQRHQRHAGPLQLPRHHRPVRLDPAPEPGPAARPGKQQPVQRPRRSDRRAAARTGRPPRPAPDIPGSCCAPPRSCTRSPVAQPRRRARRSKVLNCRIVSLFFAGIRFSLLQETDAQVLTHRNAAHACRQSVRSMIERRPASNRNAVRLHSGTASGFTSETRPDRVGIHTRVAGHRSRYPPGFGARARDRLGATRGAGSSCTSLVRGIASLGLCYSGTYQTEGANGRLIPNWSSVTRTGIDLPTLKILNLATGPQWRPQAS